jgi:hypothetical protein
LEEEPPPKRRRRATAPTETAAADAPGPSTEVPFLGPRTERCRAAARLRRQQTSEQLLGPWRVRKQGSSPTCCMARGAEFPSPWPHSACHFLRLQGAVGDSSESEEELEPPVEDRLKEYYLEQFLAAQLSARGISDSTPSVRTDSGLRIVAAEGRAPVGHWAPPHACLMRTFFALSAGGKSARPRLTSQTGARL